MFDLMALPVPDLGLKCPHCGAALAGHNEHRCAACGESFNLLTVLAQHRPIPDLGLACPTCGYSLTGLDGSRCPECGVEFSLADVLQDAQEFEAPPDAPDPNALDPRMIRRDPWFTGRERPLPDFGLACDACGEMLVGAAGDNCPSCGEPFDLSRYQAGGDWMDISAAVPSGVSTGLTARFDKEQVPYFLVVPWYIYGPRTAGLGTHRLFVRRAFVFDALHLLAKAEAELATEVPETREWECPSCGEKSPGNFGQCWNCQTERVKEGGT